MEILAENRFTLTKSLFYEGMRRVTADGYGKLARKAVIFLAVAWLVLAAATLWMRQGLGYVLMEAVIMSLMALWLEVYLPRSKTKRAFKALQAQSGPDMDRVARFYDDHLELTAGDREKTVYYTEIEKILASQRLLILMTEDRTGILLAKDGFVSGGEDAIRALIDEAKARAEEESEEEPEEEMDEEPEELEEAPEEEPEEP